MIGRAIISMLSVLCSILNIYSQNPQFPECFEFNILSVDYEYKSEDIVPNDVYSVRGDFKIKFEVEGAQKIVIWRSIPNQKEDNIKFIIGRILKTTDESKHEIETTYESVEWGTFFKFHCYKDSLLPEIWACFGPICSNDYVMESDKELLFGQSKIESVSDDFEITVTDVSVIIDNPSEELANVEIYNMQGQLVYSTKHTEPRITIDKYMLPKGICILRLRINNNYLTRKLQI